MKLYLCVFPDLTFMFVQAESKMDAAYRIDVQVQQADPAWVTRFSEPFMLKGFWGDPEETGGKGPDPSLVPVVDDHSRHDADFLWEVIDREMPHLKSYFESVRDGAEPSAEKMREAMKKDREEFEPAFLERDTVEESERAAGELTSRTVSGTDPEDFVRSRNS